MPIKTRNNEKSPAEKRPLWKAPWIRAERPKYSDRKAGFAKPEPTSRAGAGGTVGLC